MRLALCLALLLSATARADGDAKTYKQLELFARVLSYVQNNYVEPVDDQKLVYGAITGMVGTLDPHTVFMPPDVFKGMKIDTSGEFGGLGIEIAKKKDVLTVVAPLDDTPASRAGVRTGDQLLAIDGESTQGMDLATAIQKLRGPAGQRVILTLMREGFRAPQEIAVIRDHIRIVSVQGELFDGIGHVRVKNFQERTDLDLHRELDRLRKQNGGKELRGLVLDLRNNPGGLLDQAVAVSDRFLPGNLTIVTTKGRGGQNVTEEKSKDADTEPHYPMAVLVNAGSASASEIVAGALQDHARAAILGTPTFGKGSVQTVIELEDGSGLKLTIARYYTPKGRSIQERGIVPDYLVDDESIPKGEVLREKDLQGHFHNDAQRDSSTTKPLPALRKFAAAEKVTDAPLKAALAFVNQQAQTPASAQAP